MTVDAIPPWRCVNTAHDHNLVHGPACQTPATTDEDTPIFDELLAELGPVVQAAHLASVEAQADTEAHLGAAT